VSPEQIKRGGCAPLSDRTAAVVLAAGYAQRFGAPKLLLPFGDSTIVGCVVSALQQAGAQPIIVVAGEQTPEIADSLRGTPARVVRNPLPARGMVSSLRVGVAELPDNIAGFLVALADQPLLRADHISRLLRERSRAGKGIALPTYRGKRGHPVLFAGCYRSEVLALSDSHTLRDLIHAHPDDILEVECPSDAVLRDIDTPAEYRDELRRRGALGGDPDAAPVPGRPRGIKGAARPRRGYAEIARLQQSGRGALLATPLWSVGSVPFRQHAKLILRDDGTIEGTVGGGLLEARVLEAARQAISDGELGILEFDLTASDAAESGMICGGRCAVLLEPIAPSYFPDIFAAAARAEATAEPLVLIILLPADAPPTRLALAPDGALLGAAPAGQAEPRLLPCLRELADQAYTQQRPIFVQDPVRAHLDPLLPAPSLFIFGAGHISLPLAHMADLIGFRTVVIDDRADFASRDRFPDADEVVAASVPAAFSQLLVGEDGYVVVVTRGHVFDEDVVAHSLRTPARYIGMIGSRRKVAAVFERLRKRGFSDADLARVHAPIGLNIGADTVEEIAVSILAQLIEARRA